MKIKMIINLKLKKKKKKDCSKAKTCFECKSQDGCGFCATSNQCFSVNGFPSNCLPAYACPVDCTPSCGDKECGPYDGCGGICGVCSNNRYCSNDGYCRKLPSAAGNFMGGMFLGVSLVIIAGVAYYCYAKRAGGSYQGLN